MTSFFITGTDTDVGKTVATAFLSAYFQSKGKKVIPYKPVQSGAFEGADKKLVAPDVEIYKKALSIFKEKDAYTYLLNKPSSPHLAAREEKIVIEPRNIMKHYALLENQYDTVLVEGAGGLMVPLTDHGYCIIDLIKDLRLPIVLVARAGLGTINHTVLSVMAVQQAGIPVAGIILNRQQESDETIENDNQKMIEQLTNIPVLGVIPVLHQIEETFKDEAFMNKLFATFQFDKLKEDTVYEFTSTARE